MAHYTDEMRVHRGSQLRPPQHPRAERLEVRCQLFQMAGQPMYKPVSEAHVRALGRPGGCTNCPNMDKCRPPGQSVDQH